MIVTPWNGKRIQKPGWYSGIPLELYHSAAICDGPAVSSSDLRTCWLKSPAHMYSKWAENPNRIKKEATVQMQLGTAAHFMLLGEDKFALKFIEQKETYRDKKTAEEKPWNNNADVCKAWNAEQKAKGLTIVKREQLDAIVGMAKSLALLPLVQQDIMRGEVECSGFVKDRETGLWIKVRPDVIPTLTGDFVDLKTTTDVTDVALMSTIRTYAYHQQGALIWEVVDQIGVDHPFAQFFFIFVETAEPFCSRAFPLPQRALDDGRKQNRAMLRRIAECIEQKRWPGPGDDNLNELGLSLAEYERIEQRLKYEGIA